MAAPVTADVLASPALPLLLALEAREVHVELTADGRLIAEPASRLTAAEQATFRTYARELATLLRRLDVGVVARRDAFRAQLDATPAPQTQAFLFRPDVPYVRGTCFSCADRLPTLHFGRCWRCSLAWRLACRLPIPADVADARDAAKVVA